MFLSDNNSGVHPKVLEAIAQCNTGHELPYGGDSYTQKAIEKFKDVFGQDIDIYFVSTGTAANIIGLGGLLRPFEGVICADTAHINSDECGAFERFTGSKLLYAPNRKGKLCTEDVQTFLHSRGDEHQVQPKVISISQTTELGTVYSIAEIKALTDFAHQHHLLVHMDGARVANAAAALNVTLKDITIGAGIDLLSFGGTKNGLMMGEAIISFRSELSEHFKYIRKQGMQLLSKMRYVSAQFSAYLEDDLWQKNAQHANTMAKYLAEELQNIPGISLAADAQANMLFVHVPREWLGLLQERHIAYVMDEETNLIRLVTSFDTTREDVDHLIHWLKTIK